MLVSELKLGKYFDLKSTIFLLQYSTFIKIPLQLKSPIYVLREEFYSIRQV